MKERHEFNLIINSLVSDKSISGGDRISLEITKGIQRHGYPVRILTTSEGISLIRCDGIKAESIEISDFPVSKYGLAGAYCLRILKGAFLRLKQVSGGVVFSSSDFLTDVVPAFFLKGSRMKWIAGFYLVAKNPFCLRNGFSIRQAVYFFAQRISIFLMRLRADIVLVLNKADKVFLQERGIAADKIIITSGGVDSQLAASAGSNARKEYDACFIGRFHPQKGVSDLLTIWNLVCAKRPQSRLAIIGWGDRENTANLNKGIKDYRLESRIDLLGVLDGQEKFRILNSSKVFVFPSHYESWGVVVCEAMACGLPVVCYDLKVLSESFSGGLVAVTPYDRNEFAQKLADLIDNEEEIIRLGRQAMEQSRLYDWDIVSKKAFGDIKELLCV